MFRQDIKREFRDERFGFGVELSEVFAHWIKAAGAGRGGDGLHGRRPIFSCLLLSLFVRIADMTRLDHSGDLRGQPFHHRCASFGACLLIRFLFYPEPLSGFCAFFVRPATEPQSVEERGGNRLNGGEAPIGAVLQSLPDLGDDEEAHFFEIANGPRNAPKAHPRSRGQILQSVVEEAMPNPKRPKFIQKAIEKIHDAYTDLSVLLTLNFHIHGFKVRSERREAYSKVLAVVLEHTDLATLRVGIPTENGFFNYTLEYLAARTGMGLRRVARAIRDLKKMSFLIISQIRERLTDGSYRSFSAIKTVSTTLFDALGLRGWLDKERAKARERLRMKQKAYEKACAKRGATMIKRLTAQIAGMAPTSHAHNADEKAQEKTAKKRQTPVPTITATTGTRNLDPVSKYLDQLNPEAKALISKLALDILTQHPDWSRDNIYAEAKKLLPGVYRSPQSLPT